MYQVIKHNLLVTIFSFLISCYAVAQPKQAEIAAPHLKNGNKLNAVLRLGYRGEINKYIVITMKFKISTSGRLDTLSVSENAPKAFIDWAREQLSRLSGLWIPQRNNGKPVLSKWLVTHYYIGGFREDTSACVSSVQKDFYEAYAREEDLFLCNKKVDPLKCLIDYIEGSQYYLLPPLLSNTVR